MRLEDRTRDHTAVSVNGLREAGFTLGYHATGGGSGTWMFEMPDYDLQRFSSWRVTGGAVPQGTGDWTHLAGVYDAEKSWMGLYVNGALVGQGTRRSHWSASGPVQIGRSYQRGRYVNHWSGSLAEVKVYDRMVFQEEIDKLRYLPPTRKGYWQLNGENDDRTTSEFKGGPSLTLSGDADIYQAPPDDPFAEQPLMGVGDLRLNETGSEGCATTSVNLVDTRESFSLTTRVKLSAIPTRSMTVWSLPGTTESGATNTNLLVLRYSEPDNAWQVVITHANETGAQTTSVLNADVSAATQSAGQLLTVGYNSYTDEITLYAGGTATSAKVDFVNAWHALGGLQIGRSLDATGTGQEHFSGIVDDFRMYRGVLSPDTVQRLSDVTTEQPDI